GYLFATRGLLLGYRPKGPADEALIRALARRACRLDAQPGLEGSLVAPARDSRDNQWICYLLHYMAEQEALDVRHAVTIAPHVEYRPLLLPIIAVMIHYYHIHI